MPPTSTVAQAAAWRAAYDMTEHQATLVVALITAHLLGYDGATGPELLSADVPPSAVGSLLELERKRLVAVVGYTEDRKSVKVWGATPTAWRRFEIIPPRPIPLVVVTEAGRAEMMLDRLRTRRKHADRKRYARSKGRVA